MAGKGRYWPLAIVGLLVAGAAANIGLMLVANSDASFAVEPDYYKKALDWDRTMAQETANAALGWSVSARLEREPEPGGARLVARVVDRDGAPVAGARVDVVAFPSARASRFLRAALRPEAAGVYAAALPGSRPGLWELRVTVARGDLVFTQTLAADLAGRP